MLYACFLENVEKLNNIFFVLLRCPCNGDLQAKIYFMSEDQDGEGARRKQQTKGD